MDEELLHTKTRHGSSSSPLTTGHTVLTKLYNPSMCTYSLSERFVPTWKNHGFAGCAAFWSSGLPLWNIWVLRWMLPRPSARPFAQTQLARRAGNRLNRRSSAGGVQGHDLLFEACVHRSDLLHSLPYLSFTIHPRGVQRAMLPMRRMAWSSPTR